jgi:thiol-disulfide isomerase/thioredoxin
MEKKKNKKNEKQHERKPERVPDTNTETSGNNQPATLPRDGPDNKMRIAIVLLAIAVLGCAVYFAIPLLNASPSAPSPGTGSGNVTVYFFYGKECPHCHNVMPYVESLRQKYPDVEFRILEIWHDDTNNALLSLLNHKLGRQEGGVPEVVIGNISLLGEDEIKTGLEPAILNETGNHTRSSELEAFPVSGSSAGTDTSPAPTSLPAGRNVSLK